MIKNYLKIAFRNLWKHKAFTTINILGLCVGITASFLILLYVSFELSYDSFHSKADRIYRIVCDIKTPTEVINAGGPAWAVAPNVKQEFPEVEAFVRIAGDDDLLMRNGDIKFQQKDAMWADSAFFDVFDYKLIKGDRRTALKEPISIVFTKSTAKKYFGDKDPMGQTILITGEGFPAKVTGVMEDMPENSQIKGDVVLSMSTITQKFNASLDSQWGNYGAQAYLLLKANTNAKSLEKKFPDFLERRNGTEMKQNQMYATLFLEKLKDVYLRSTRNGSKTGNINNVYIFSVVAIFILLIACINFINLATARSAERAKEVGLRKVVGAEKSQLARQFLGESVILTLIAVILSVGLTALLLPMFNQLAGKTISSGIFSQPLYLAYLLAGAIIIGIVAGIYPAIVLSSFTPVTVLKGKFSTSMKGILLRKGLVVSQFAISIALIIGTIIVYLQMNHMRSSDLGFNKDQLLVINSGGDPAKQSFKESLRSIPGVKSTATTSSVPGGNNPGAYSEIENKQGDLQIANLDLYFVDFDFIPQLDIKMVAGRPFSRDFGTDTTQAMVLNEAAVKLFGYTKPEEAIGRRFKQWGREGKIIGVAKDFHFRSLQQQIKPLSMRIEPNGTQLITVRLNADNLSSTISSIQGNWNKAVPNRPFDYYFLDEFFDKQYRAEERFGKLFLNFAVIAIFISCLGLLGLASYSTMQRTREIGVRKVMGASVASIINLLSKDFLKLVLISFVIAAPLAGYIMYQWLKDFAFRINISWWIFGAAGIIALFIAIVTVSFQAVKAAVVNPVKSLRSE
ncbi:ABC transporter permease [Pollutibacter soli]|uniref:ABC transporter permease n=1 Tax=Pollutibacter soli TaxID=3034157 RepID=UPI003013E247